MTCLTDVTASDSQHMPPKYRAHNRKMTLITFKTCLHNLIIQYMCHMVRYRLSGCFPIVDDLPSKSTQCRRSLVKSCLHNVGRISFVKPTRHNIGDRLLDYSIY